MAAQIKMFLHYCFARFCVNGKFFLRGQWNNLYNSISFNKTGA